MGDLKYLRSNKFVHFVNLRNAKIKYKTILERPKLERNFNNKYQESY